MTTKKRKLKARVPSRAAHGSALVRVTRRKPKVNEKFGESDYLLCYESRGSTPFVGWYNRKLKAWYVAHHSAPSTPQRVQFWRDLPPNA